MWRMVPFILLSGCIHWTEDIPCLSTANCPSEMVCNLEQVCVGADDPSAPEDCSDDFTVTFPSFRIDAYESSRADATATSAGTRDGMACSVPGVLPWQLEDVLHAEAACALAGKRLCTEVELSTACRGTEGRTYPYGSEYEEGICNDASGSGQVEPTGTFVDCTDTTGAVHDLVGNVAEVCDGCLGWYGTHGGGITSSEGFSARCGGTDNYSSASGGGVGMRCCQDLP